MQPNKKRAWQRPQRATLRLTLTLRVTVHRETETSYTGQVSRHKSFSRDERGARRRHTRFRLSAAAAAMGGSSTMRDVTLNLQCGVYASQTFTQIQSNVVPSRMLGIYENSTGPHDVRRPPTSRRAARRACGPGRSSRGACGLHTARRSVSIGLYKAHTGSHSRGSRAATRPGAGAGAAGGGRAECALHVRAQQARSRPITRVLRPLGGVPWGPIGRGAHRLWSSRRGRRRGCHRARGR